ncbi:TMEM175 family protein [Microbacterium sp. NPDC056052]|uniref:TMEM175 family protein n=1 Tax=Microbacterium sp. NPDC056052 TaxID=3345695 RepID=UPI0035DAB3EA
MTSSRLEAFSDGVLAIVITAMVLGLAVPKADRRVERYLRTHHGEVPVGNDEEDPAP